MGGREIGVRGRGWGERELGDGGGSAVRERGGSNGESQMMITKIILEGVVSGVWWLCSLLCVCACV
jgi:hypothetical protein